MALFRQQWSFLSMSGGQTLGLLAFMIALGLSCNALGMGTADPKPLIPLTNDAEWRATGPGPIQSAWLRILDGSGALRLVTAEDAIPYTLPLEQSDNGLSVEWSRGLPRIEGSMRLEYPIEAGSSYQHADTVGTGRTYQVSVSRDSVSVPAGTFECLRYTIRKDTLIAEAALKPGLGPVWVYLAAEQDTLSLTSTTVAP